MCFCILVFVPLYHTLSNFLGVIPSKNELKKQLLPTKNNFLSLFAALGTGNDNFVKCPSQALEWPTRRFRMIEEIAQHNADVICLQEIDHFNFFRKALATLGYVGHFTPKPDSPCLNLADNSGPDGCAIFYKKDKFDLVTLDSRVLEVWNVQSNQVR